MAEIIRLDLEKDYQEPVRRAALALASGELAAYPTESFYGLGADALNETAVRRLFLLKKRSTGRPILILIPSRDMLDSLVTDIPSAAVGLMDAFWPGGLTLVFRASDRIPPLLTGGTGKIGIRLSSHPVPTALAAALGAPITGTSANISGSPPCREAKEVLDSIGEGLSVILDGGRTGGEQGSTVMDITTHPARILREGLVPRNLVEEVLPDLTCP
jgi:L-threonylcarbamoyladenylate synthase